MGNISLVLDFLIVGLFGPLPFLVEREREDDGGDGMRRIRHGSLEEVSEHAQTWMFLHLYDFLPRKSEFGAMLEQDLHIAVDVEDFFCVLGKRRGFSVGE